MLFEPRSVQQSATLPFVSLADGIRVLLITSRRRKRWIVPKGWPHKNLSLAESAAREAYEEAGVLGPVQLEPIGTYIYDKDMGGYTVPCHVFVYPLMVRQHALTWEEQGKRKLRWLPLGDAAGQVDDSGLAELLHGFAADDGAALRACEEALSHPEAQHAVHVIASVETV